MRKNIQLKDDGVKLRSANINDRILYSELAKCIKIVYRVQLLWYDWNFRMNVWLTFSNLTKDHVWTVYVSWLTHDCNWRLDAKDFRQAFRAWKCRRQVRGFRTVSLRREIATIIMPRPSTFFSRTDPKVSYLLTMRTCLHRCKPTR